MTHNSDRWTTEEADALSRLGMEIDGLVVQNVFAVSVPERIRSAPQDRLYDRMASETLRWSEPLCGIRESVVHWLRLPYG